MIDFVTCFWQVDDAKISRATIDCDVTFNNIVNCTDSKATSNAFFESKWLSVVER